MERLETISLFIEAFEDFLDEKGIVIPNDEKDDDPDASNIYGTDYGILSDRIEELLTRLENTSEPTEETRFKDKYGSDVIVQRYGQDDYAVWCTDDPDDDSSGCSTRGSFLAIVNELKDVL